RNGLIVAHWGTGDSGRRRRYYRITDGGLEALAAERFEWETLNRTLNELWRAPNA
ncbi:MAG: PadR family transcriptional regulator PadR, partial [Planctomycetota bacterium]